MGGGDPLDFLAREGVEWTIAQAVLKKASAMDVERRKALIQGLGVSSSNAFGRLLAKLFKR